jgi:hypothetical protein
MQEIAERLERVEHRLERLLVSGWRNAGSEASDMVGEADALAGLGLEQLAERLRAVAAASSAAEGLSAIVLAAAGCRLLRARLPAPTTPPGPHFEALAGDLRQPAAHRLLPVSRLALVDGEAWACVRLHGATPTEWLLLEPPSLGQGDVGPVPPPPQPSAGTAARLRAGLAARFERGKPAVTADDHRPAADSRPWLERPLRGYLRWLARHPLGATGSVECCRLEGAEWTTPSEARADAVDRFRTAVASGKVEDDQPVFGTRSALRLKLLDAREADTYAWVDSAAATAFRAAAGDRAWAIAWCQDDRVTPLAVIAPGGRFAQARLVHLVPGCPEESL